MLAQRLGKHLLVAGMWPSELSRSLVWHPMAYLNERKTDRHVSAMMNGCTGCDKSYSSHIVWSERTRQQQPTQIKKTNFSCVISKDF